MNAERKNFMFIGAALVAVLALGSVAYKYLSAKQEFQPVAQASTATNSDVGSSESSSQDSASSAEEGSSASSEQKYYLADFDATLYTKEGAATKLTEIADGKPLLINFWATWCPYCVQEFPDFQNIYQDYSDKVNFAFIDSVDGSRETVKTGSAWLKENGFDLPAYYDTELEATYTYGIRSLPTTAVFAADGELVHFSPGMINADNIRAILDSVV